MVSSNYTASPLGMTSCVTCNIPPGNGVGKHLSLSAICPEVEVTFLEVLDFVFRKTKIRGPCEAFTPARGKFLEKRKLCQGCATPLKNAYKALQILQDRISNMSYVVRKINKTFKDTGVGIDYDIIPRLFTKFTSKSQTGTGLGLFLSKSIVEAHSGRMWAENNNSSNNGKQQGATFYFTLPVMNG